MFEDLTVESCLPILQLLLQFYLYKKLNLIHLMTIRIFKIFQKAQCLTVVDSKCPMSFLYNNNFFNILKNCLKLVSISKHKQFVRKKLSLVIVIGFIFNIIPWTQIIVIGTLFVSFILSFMLSFESIINVYK